jgi:DNA polymerase (family 10)
LRISSRSKARIRSRFARYRNAADTIVHAPDNLSVCSDEQIRAMAGIGKDLAAKIREICERAARSTTASCWSSFPPPFLTCCTFKASGPKTVALLYAQLGVRTLEELEAACKDGRVRELKGLGPKKESMILKALEERKQRTGRHLLPDAAETAEGMLAYLRGLFPTASFTQVGSVRRGAETSGDIDILATGADASLMTAFVAYRLVERVLGQGETEIQRATAGWHSGGPQAGAAGKRRRRHAIFHRFQSA